MRLPFGFGYRLSAAIIDLALWFVIIGVFYYLFPGTGFLMGFIVLSIVLTVLDRIFGDKTIGQTLLGLESKKEELTYKKEWWDKVLKLIAWLIPFSYFIQPFWVKTISEEKAWYDKTLSRKIIISQKRNNSKLTYPVLVVLLLATIIALTSYFVVLPF